MSWSVGFLPGLKPLNPRIPSEKRVEVSEVLGDQYAALEQRPVDRIRRPLLGVHLARSVRVRRVATDQLDVRAVGFDVRELFELLGGGAERTDSSGRRIPSRVVLFVLGLAFAMAAW